VAAGADISLRGMSGNRRALATGVAAGFVLGVEAHWQPSSDAGKFLGASTAIVGVGMQRRNSVVTDVRTRGNHVGQLLASGSYWVPARADLDTLLNKIDSRIIEDMIVIRGPYSALHGPGFSFVDFQLLPSPRYEDGFESHGSTCFDYKTNGNQWYGRQSVWAGSYDWGMRFSYGHRTGNDYRTGDAGGDDFALPASYNSRDIDFALGYDPSQDERLDFHYLRLDQTGVEFPGMVFDMRFLVTDSFELTYTVENQAEFDQLSANAWYNRTRFEGDTLDAGKNRQIPTLRCNLYPFDGSGNPASIDNCILNPSTGQGTAITDVYAASTGYSAIFAWGEEDTPQLSLGTDFRFVDRELNDIENQRPADRWNFPIPPCYSANPGIMTEYAFPTSRGWSLRTGGRFDWVITDAEDSVPGVGDATGAILITERLKTDRLDRHFTLWSWFLTGEWVWNDNLTFEGAFGLAERPPNLTELYTAGSFINLLQSGLTTLTGDPELEKERIRQLDVGLTWEYPRYRGSLTGFYSWIEDYITFDGGLITEAQIGQKNNRVSLVNTDLATIAGFEVRETYEVTPMLELFATAMLQEGRDHTRRKPGRLRGVGDRSGVSTEEEPLPNIPAYETRLGLRLHSDDTGAEGNCGWSVTLVARVVDTQDRAAYSLFERHTPGFTVWNVRSHAWLTEQLMITAGVENLFDRFYREHLDYRAGLGVYQPGITGYVGSELIY